MAPLRLDKTLENLGRGKGQGKAWWEEEEGRDGRDGEKQGCRERVEWIEAGV